LYKRLKLSENLNLFCYYTKDLIKKESVKGVVSWNVCKCDNEFILVKDSCREISDSNVDDVVNMIREKNEIYMKPKFVLPEKKRLNIM